jgi:flagellar export protein FliJ
VKTPYDTLARLRQRELDEKRLELAAAEERVQTVAERLRAIEQQSVAQAEVASALFEFDFSQFRRRLRASSEAAASDRRHAETGLEAARQRGIEAFIAKKAVDLAADRYREVQALRTARSEQARLDEIAARTNR